MNNKQISELTDVRPNRISEIRTAYKRKGAEALKPKKRGRKPKNNMLLTPQEQKEIRQTIISKTPEQMKLAGFLWTLAKISRHIYVTYGKVVSVRCLSNYMKRWGLTCQRPTKCACGYDVDRINKFMKDEYPAIKKCAEAEKADIY